MKVDCHLRDSIWYHLKKIAFHCSNYNLATFMLPNMLICLHECVDTLQPLMCCCTIMLWYATLSMKGRGYFLRTKAGSIQ